MIKSYALITNETILVVNTIVADETFQIEGYYLMEILDGILCQTGIYYNELDGLFYYGEGFTTTIRVTLE
ncbi:hypothetical protein J1781_18885 [Rahnella sp. C60]|uniref:hypothetical protein n=1 Tax=Rahnella perminowiae TaxID=2816244 RepID=UPI001C25887F|nr:hypothetical protein [Rahnella perminowiae]MBU9816892.1 hypothetical protein [Rahnella perminowiae]MCR9000439.1 hypothetical protein [Rahnella perminowiae]MCX2943760.1 hypothetical protein [Rahnella perminowiae]UJD90444.1 hypothetical protein FS594_17560 [Rahnella aquatilis]